MTHPLVTAARRYLGRPFRHRARGPSHYDCAGLLLKAFADIGAPMKDLPYYGREPHRDGLRQIVQHNLGPPVDGPYAVGDVLLVRFGVNPHHIALVGDYVHGGHSIIHADGEVGRVLEVRLDAGWHSQVVEAYRWNPA